MICEHCGKELDLDNTYLMVNTLHHSPLRRQTSYLGCRECIDKIYNDCLSIFDKELIERNITILKVEALSDDLK